jgi:hypothetical protein
VTVPPGSSLKRLVGRKEAEAFLGAQALVVVVALGLVRRLRLVLWAEIVGRLGHRASLTL